MSNTEAKKIMEQLAAEMTKPIGAQRKDLIKKLQKKLDAALGMSIDDNDEQQRRIKERYAEGGDISDTALPGDYHEGPFP